MILSGAIVCRVNRVCSSVHRFSFSLVVLCHCCCCIRRWYWMLKCTVIGTRVFRCQKCNFDIRMRTLKDLDDAVWRNGCLYFHISILRRTRTRRHHFNVLWCNKMCVDGLLLSSSQRRNDGKWTHANKWCWSERFAIPFARAVPPTVIKREEREKEMCMCPMTRFAYDYRMILNACSCINT